MTEMYSPGVVQKLLGMDGNTLRRYASLLEGHGYHIHRNNRGHRGYFEKDVDTLRKLMEFSKQDGMTMERSVEAAMIWASKEYKTDLVMEESSLQNTTDSVSEEGPFQNTANTASEESSFQNTTNAVSEESPFQNTTNTVSEERPKQNTTDYVMEESLLQNTTDPVAEESGIENAADSVAEESGIENTADSIAEESPFQNVNDLDIEHVYSNNEHVLLERIENLQQINLELIQILREKAVQGAYQEQKINQIMKYVENTAQLASERSQLEEARMQIAAANQKKWWKWWKWRN